MTNGPRVLIVGGSGGIGSAIARQCAAAGAWPLVGYCGRRDLAQHVVEQCGCGEIVPLDLSQDDFSSVERLRRVDAVVYAAGIFSHGRSLLKISDEELNRLVSVNMLAPLRLTRTLLDYQLQLRDVIFILSTASFGRGHGPYALSKIGELAVCKLMIDELAERGTRVNAIAPGWTETPMAAQAAGAATIKLDDIRATHLDGRFVAPDEIGELCAELLCESPRGGSGRLAVWDRREARDPVWLNLETVFACDELAWTMPSVTAGLENPQS